ncbi:MAG TPA: hypothetical protein VJV05_10750 [Pyrinomonadaceae bacterium]|nr:hypothetical protein [Pyrinomonadaceae bacterium]
MRWRVFLVIAVLVGVGSIEAMAQTKYTAVQRGDWGGTGIAVVVKDKTVAIEFDCAVGEISTQLKMDGRGKFVALGTYRNEMHGPIRLKFQPKPQPARYEGRVSSKTMRFKVILTGTGEVVGDFSAELGKAAQIRKCR